MTQPAWTPTPASKNHSQMQAFIHFCNQQYQLDLYDYPSLYRWSITRKNDFWLAVSQFCQINYTQKAERALTLGKTMRDATWFEGATLNFAENLLKRNDTHTAILYTDEQGSHRKLTYAQLHEQVASLAAELEALGIKPGDRVAGFMTNCPETVIAMLATTSLGAIWTACSSDFGEQAVIDRFEQIEPKVLFAITEHTYKGKIFSHRDKIKRIEKALPSLIKTFLIDPTKKHNLTSKIKKTKNTFSAFPFSHPLYILYSSGTTGKPKCMVHGAGNTLVQHLKELILHTDLKPEDKIFFNTTCGWMMWNWLVSSLAIGATIVLYEGAPFYPNPTHLIDLIDQFKITVFGIGAKYFETLEQLHIEPIKTHKLTSLKTILSTGSPLLPNTFDYIYQKIKKDVRVSSISGGSDIVSCFGLGNPLLPVYRGELQCIGLGMHVEIFDENAKPQIEKKGELVCIDPFPAMPIYFWKDSSGEKYHNAYFAKFPNVWAHGDYAEITQHDGLIIYGRSDATLNPGGVRVGTAEIYQQVAKISEVNEALAVEATVENDKKIILFVILKEKMALTDDLIQKIKKQIRDNTSPFHVPAKIIAAPDFPRTISGKTSEITVKKILQGEPIQNKEALSNPESLVFFESININHISQHE